MNEWLRKGIGSIGCLLMIGQFSIPLQSQDLIQPAPDMPAYTLGSIQHGKDTFGRPAVTIDCKRTKEGIGVAMVAGRFTGGPLRILDSGVSSEELEKLQLTDFFKDSKGLDGEVYLVVVGSFAEECEFTCLVSNVVHIGNPSVETAIAREWNSAESLSYQKELVGRKPPYGVPDGHQLVRASTKLIAGMPLKVGRYGKWVDAEALTGEATVTVKIAGAVNLRTFTRDGWLAIDPAVLQLGVASPSSFKPSVNVIPGTSVILPDGYSVVTKAMQLVPGTPVRAIWLNQLQDATVISLEGERVLTHYDSKPSLLDKKCNRGELVIDAAIVEELTKPDAAERFQDRVPKMPSVDEGMNLQEASVQNGSKGMQTVVDSNRESTNNEPNSASNSAVANAANLPLTLQNNPIDIPIPREAELLPLDFPIPRGTKLAACSGQRWNYVTVLKDNKDDTVPIHWDNRTPDYDGLIHRTQLIIRKSDLRKLRIKATRSEKRVWTDSTGKHTVEATLASRTSTQVTLLRDDGKEVTLSIDKLSIADQKWLRDNP